MVFYALQFNYVCKYMSHVLKQGITEHHASLAPSSECDTFVCELGHTWHVTKPRLISFKIQFKRHSHSYHEWQGKGSDIHVCKRGMEHFRVYSTFLYGKKNYFFFQNEFVYIFFHHMFDLKDWNKKHRNIRNFFELK